MFSEINYTFSKIISHLFVNINFLHALEGNFFFTQKKQLKAILVLKSNINFIKVTNSKTRALNSIYKPYYFYLVNLNVYL